INNSPGRKACDVELQVITLYFFSYKMRCIVSEYEEPPLKGIASTGTISRFNKHLLNMRFNFSGARAGHAVINRHHAESDQFQPQGFDLCQQNFTARFRYFLITWKEDHTDPILAGLGQGKTQLITLLSKELMRYLYEHAGTIAGLWVTPATTPVLHIFQHRKGITQYVVGFRSIDIGNTSDATGVMF